MAVYFIAILLAAFLALAYHFGNQFNLKKKSYNNELISFSAGISITYLILELFPKFTAGALQINKLLFISVLFGFIIHHLIEKNIYTHHHLKNELKRLLNLEENIFSFVYHLVIGILLVFFLKENLVQGFLFFIPIFSFTLINSLSTEPHNSFVDSLINSSASLIGVVLTILFYDLASLWFFYLMLGLITGILMFSVTRHHIPFGKKGKPGYFIMAFLIYSLVIISSWYF